MTPERLRAAASALDVYEQTLSALARRPVPDDEVQRSLREWAAWIEETHVPEISVGGTPATTSYSTARGNFSMIHAVALFLQDDHWKALQRGLCGAQLLVVDGRLQFAGLPAGDATCHRCQRELGRLGVLTGAVQRGDVMVPAWRPEEDRAVAPT